MPDTAINAYGWRFLGRFVFFVWMQRFWEVVLSAFWAVSSLDSKAVKGYEREIILHMLQIIED
ncbi:hypothetical protein AU385_01630 [Bacillus halotolerans]|uniref:hypothetical protein n=1 Tax=Bacillus halotolerans TaxID=260554 RepID=UPI0007506EAB|nr:hypothetical protein [Bacillus halotolerans]KUP37788.1 hypothetical protein AU385_01630 [Bacillus halotolerans]